MTSKPILLILGHGANVGVAVTQKFRSLGWRVAISSRTVDEKDKSDEGVLPLKCDFSDPTAVEKVFSKVRKAWGEPSVVFYNAAKNTSGRDEDLLNISTADLQAQMNVNFTSAWVAAREAIAGFQKLDDGSKTPRMFAYTGNMLPWKTFAPIVGLGAGKTAMTHVLKAADEVFREKERDVKFFFLDERKEDGTPMWKGVTGSAHADFLADLVERKAGEVPWKATFVDGLGYKYFEE